MVNIVRFEETIFVTTEGVGQPGDWDEESREQIHNIRNSNPEISHWGDLAVGMAIGDYSQSILAVGFAEWVRDRNTALMAYIYIRQKYPDFYFGSTGNYMEELWDYCDTLPWLNNAPAPHWVDEQIKEKKSNRT